MMQVTRLFQVANKPQLEFIQGYRAFIFIEMKKYKITFQNGESVTVNGKLITQCEATGQIFIYFENDPTWKNISAIVPASACVVVIG